VPRPVVEVSGPVALAPLLEPTAVTPLVGWLSRAPRRFLDDRRIWMPVAGAGVLLLLLAVVLGRGGSERAPAPAVARPAVTADQPAAGPAATVEIVITSIPEGAMVIDQASGERLGPTPYRERRPAAPGVRAFLLEKQGHQPEVVSVRTDVSSEAQVVLAALAPPPVPAVSPPPRAARPRTKKSVGVPANKEPAPVGDGSLDPFDK
jgi:hypothetical protein